MIITRTPFRISFLGGGSDLAAFYEQSPGSVLSVSINKYMYLSTHKFFHENEIQAKYSKTENVTSLDDLQHPIIRAVLRKFDVHGAIEISSIADIPSGTGLGSSSSFTVGLLHNLYARAGKYVTKEQLAQDACEIEIDILREPIGKQDQYAAAYGALNIFRFHSSGRVAAESVHLKQEIYSAFESNLMLFYTGRHRSASAILAEQKKNMGDGVRVSTLKDMVSLVDSGRDALYKGDLKEFGSILNASWTLKKQLASKISDNEIDLLYQKALDNGAYGGKILGAGGGGFLLVLAEPANHARIVEALHPARPILFKFEQEGSKIIYIGDEW